MFTYFQYLNYIYSSFVPKEVIISHKKVIILKYLLQDKKSDCVASSKLVAKICQSCWTTQLQWLFLFAYLHKHKCDSTLNKEYSIYGKQH